MGILDKLNGDRILYQRHDDDHSGGGSGGGNSDPLHVTPVHQAPESESRSDAIERLKDAKRRKESPKKP